MGEVVGIGQCEAMPGSKSFGNLTIAERVDGSSFLVPFAIINGKEAGPKLWIIAGTHGDEVASMVAVQRIINKVDPEKIKGTLVAIPIIDPTAFDGANKYSPIDGKNLSYCFPGDPDGTYGERLGYELFKAITSLTADCILNLHGGGTGRLQHPHVIVYQTGRAKDSEWDKKNLAVAEATGVRVVMIAKKSPEPLDFDRAVRSGRRKYPSESVGGTIKGDFTEELRKLGIPIIVIEAGGEAKVRESDANLHVQAILNVMKHMGMMPGSPIQPPKKIYFSESQRMIATKRGFWFPKVEPGDMISEGDVVAVVTDVFGKEIERLTAPFDGLVTLVRYRTKIDPLSADYVEFYGVLMGKVPKEG